MRATLRPGGRRGSQPGDVVADPRALHDEMLLALAMVALLGVVAALSVVGAGAAARPLFMLSAFCLAVVAKRRSPWLYLSTMLWVWVTTAFVRRMIEWHGGFNATDIVLVTPSLLPLLVVPDILTTRGLLTRRGAGAALLPTACVMYGLFVSFVRGDVLAGAISAVDWVVPLLYLFLFICHAERIGEAEAHLAGFLSCSLPLVVPYAFYQYFLMPDWDAAWMTSSGMGSLGYPLPMQSHVFGSMNSPGSLAILAGTCLVLLAYFRNRVLLLLAPFLFLLLAIGMVRAVYGSVLLAIVAGALAGRGGFGRLGSIVLLAGIGGAVGLAVLTPHVTDAIVARLQSMQNLEADDSARVRRIVYQQTPQLIDDNPFGTGIGAQGRGQAAQGGGRLVTVNIDSGPLSTFLGLGWFVAPLYLLGIGLLQWRALRVGRRHHSPVAAAMAAAAIVPLGTFPFVNVIGFDAVLLWTCLGYPLAVEIRATLPRRSRPVVGARA